MPRSLLVAREASEEANRADSVTASKDAETPSRGEMVDEDEEVDIDVVSEAEDKPLDFSVAAPAQPSLGTTVGTAHQMLYGESIRNSVRLINAENFHPVFQRSP